MGGIKAVILAAGYGCRLNPLTYELPKPLLPLGGVPLIERIILAARDAGIDEFLVVLGYLGDKLKTELGDGEKYGVLVEYVENPEWQMGNGVSAYKAGQKINENFVLLMGDHIFDPKTLSLLKGLEIGSEECVLCVDYNVERIFDKDGATKVWVENGKIQSIGKDLERYNAIDTGMFLCTPYFFKVLEDNIRNGRYSLNESTQTLAEQNLMKAFDIGESYWFDLDTMEDFNRAESFLQYQQFTTFVR
jgi:NDP-sugar pyrophosphorylase family protein